MQRAQAALRTFGLDQADVEDLVHDFLAVHLADLCLLYTSDAADE